MKLKKIRVNFIVLLLMMSFVFASIGIQGFAAENMTWDPVNKGAGVTLTNNNLTVDISSYSNGARATVSKSLGKWYWEITIDSSNPNAMIGIVNSQVSMSERAFTTSNARLYYNHDATIYPGPTPYGENYNINDVIGIALDCDNGTLEFFKNGISQGVAFTDISTLGEVYPFIESGSSSGGGKYTANFGATTFKYSIPEGFSSYDGSQTPTVIVPVPAAPDNTLATAGDGQIEISWNSVTDADSYNIHRATTSGGPYTTVAQEVYGTTYTDNSAANGTTYYYVVTAVNAGGESDNSNEASATPKASSAGRALLKITMANGSINEYDLSMTEVDSFITWYDNRVGGTGKAYYTIDKNYNIGPFISRKDYIIFDKVLQFEVMEYSK